MQIIRSLILLAAAPVLLVAQVPIKSLPYVIDHPGSYVLFRTQDSNTTGITIAASHVSIDLGGFALLGQRGSTDGLFVRGSQTDIAVFNGTITGWGEDGLMAQDGLNVNVHDLRVSGNGGYGLRVGHAALVTDVVTQDNGVSGLVGLEAMVVNNLTSTGNHAWGVEAGMGAVLTGNSVVSNFGGGILSAGDARITNNSVVGNGHLVGGAESASGAATLAGISVVGANAVVADNVVTGNGLGLQLVQTGSRVSGNTVAGNRTNYEFAQGNQLELLVSELPLRIEWPAVVKLPGSLNTTLGDGLIVAADGVTIDLGGHDLIARDGSGSAILVDGIHMGLTVKNGTIHGWAASGIDARNANGSMFQDLMLHKNGVFGLRTGDGCKVMNVVAHENLKDGILVGADTLVKDCTVTNNGNDGIHLGNHSMATGCVASENYLFGIRVYSGATVRDCTASHNNMGISADDGATISGNTTSFNTLIGIRADKSSIVDGNTVQGNDTGIAIMDGPGSRVAHNNLTGNGTGLLVVGIGNVVVCNSAAANTTNYSIVPGNAASQIVNVAGDPAFWVTDSWANLSY